jgi:hypothetical protein
MRILEASRRTGATSKETANALRQRASPAQPGVDAASYF